MVAFGTRIPTGGLFGDGYRTYEGIDATTVDGLNIIFDHAEVLMQSTLKLP